MQPGGNIDSVPKYVAIALHDITQVDADTDVNLVVFSLLGVVSTKLMLNLLRALHGVDHQREIHLDEDFFEKGRTPSMLRE